jgi:hypothetical protein
LEENLLFFIRYNPDKIKHKGNNLEISLEERLALLLEVVHGEISKEYYQFQVKIYQLFYDDVYDQYYRVKEKDITSIVYF